MCDGDFFFFFLVSFLHLRAALHSSQAATEQKYAGEGKVCCFDS